MDLNTLWFWIIGILFIGFFILEGFDYGVGILLPFYGKDDDERRIIINTIGPFWDGNEVWIISAGAMIFGAFPHWYATLFSGFYIAFVLLLLALIVRGVAFEFRSKDARRGWRNFWDWMIFVGSFIPALLWGVAFGNLMRGVPINAQMEYAGDFLTLLNPYALLVGVFAVAVMTLHGALFLLLRTNGDLAARVRGAVNRLWIVAFALYVLTLIASALATDMLARPTMPIVAAILGGVALFAAYRLHQRARDGWAFTMTALTIAATFVTYALTHYPRVMISTLKPEWSLTIYNAAAAPYTLTVMSVVALIFIPLVIAYQAWTYYVFRERVTRKTLEY
ncbi:MAG: cytochrome d ubiquinol oxidase subunit II [Anaerolineae bacterium]|nr:cytochrome d ubiquinol oxidase subunit II [Anaerolineae bacterium]